MTDLTQDIQPTKSSLRIAIVGTIRDAAIVAAASIVIALGFNAARSNGIPLFSQQEYDIIVPCPEPVGDPEKMAADDTRIKEAVSMVLDVRSKAEYASWHIDGALSQPFDWLGPPVDEEVAALAKQVAASRAKRVIVYGDGDDPDSGREWARLLSGARIKNVFFVVGGAPAMNPALARPDELSDLGRDSVVDDGVVDGGVVDSAALDERRGRDRVQPIRREDVIP